MCMPRMHVTGPRAKVLKLRGVENRRTGDKKHHLKTCDAQIAK